MPLLSLYPPLKTPENQRLFDVSGGYRKKPVIWNGLKEIILTLDVADIVHAADKQLFKVVNKYRRATCDHLWFLLLF